MNCYTDSSKTSWVNGWNILLDTDYNAKCDTSVSGNCPYGACRCNHDCVPDIVQIFDDLDAEHTSEVDSGGLWYYSSSEDILYIENLIP